MDEIIAQYYEDLLRAQYRVSEDLVMDQHLACGTIREEFLREILVKKRPSIKITKGFVKKGIKRSLECDQIFHHINSPIDQIGGQLFINPEHCKLVLEIKSNATWTDLNKTNLNFERIKMIDSDNQPLCGIFCYNIALKKDTILNRFWWKYDKDLENWYDEGVLIPLYSNVDFIVCIACLEVDDACTEQQFFLIKDVSSGRYMLQLEYPIIKNFFGVTDNL